MEFKISRENFLNSLSKVQAVVEKKNTMPVLSNILIKADKSGLSLSGTDLEVGLISNTAAQVIKGGEITVPSKRLFEIIREINQSEVQVKLAENDRLDILAGSSHFKIPGLKADEFPKLPEIQSDTYELSCELFSKLFDKTSFAMSTDETRQNLAGLFLEKEGEDLIRMVATDGHRLSLMEQELEGGVLGGVSVIIPKKGISELKKIVSQEGSFELAIDKKNLLARKGNESLFVRLIEGEFPDYKRVIPQETGTIASISKESLVGALRRVSLLSNERSRGVILNFSSGHLEVTINNPDLGEAQEEMKIDYKGEKISIGFNAKYLLDVLAAMEDETIFISLQNDLAPCMLKSEKDSGFTAVVMPMRI